MIKHSIKILSNVHIVLFKLNYSTEKGASTTVTQDGICLVGCNFTPSVGWLENPREGVPLLWANNIINQII